MKKLKTLVLIGLTIVVLIVFVFIPLVGHTWRKGILLRHATAAPANSWKRFFSEEGKFSILFPGEPEATSTFSDSPMTNVELHLFYVNPNTQNSFAVGFSDNPLFTKMLGLPDPQVYLKTSQFLMASNVQGKIVYEQASKFEDYPARECEYVAGGKANYSVRLKSILVGQRVYEIYVVFLTAEPFPQERTIFFNSFKIQNNTNSVF